MILKKTDLPIVFFDRVPDKIEAHTITCNMEAGMKEATEFLIFKGHSRIALINGPRNMLASRERLMGYKNILNLNRIEVI